MQKNSKELQVFPSQFTHLKPQTLASYSIIYNKNPCYKIQSLENVVSHDALHFKKFESTTQQANLCLEYTSLPNIMADLAIAVLLGRVQYLKDYPRESYYRIFANEKENHGGYKTVFKRLLTNFVVSDIAKKKSWMGKIHPERIFYFERPNADIEFYPDFMFGKVGELLFQSTYIQINYSRSNVRKETVKLCLDLTYPSPR